MPRTDSPGSGLETALAMTRLPNGPMSGSKVEASDSALPSAPLAMTLPGLSTPRGSTWRLKSRRASTRSAPRMASARLAKYMPVE